MGTTGDFTKVSLGQIRYRGGRIRFVGALLPMPSDEFDHPFGLDDYSLTYSGYQVLKEPAPLAVAKKGPLPGALLSLVPPVTEATGL